MKKHLALGFAALLFGVQGLSAADGIGGLKTKMAKFGDGKSREKMMVFNGGRPWAARDMARPLVNNGIRVAVFHGEYLAGFSGASIKQHMSDPVEPTPFDGFTPAFETLAQKGPAAARLVVFNNIETKGLREVFDAPGAVEKLKKYVEAGGNLLFTACAPSGGALDGILPVVLSDETISPGKDWSADRPAGAFFAGFPDPLPVYESVRVCRELPGCEVLSRVSCEGKSVAPYIVRRRIGKGSVTYWNVDVKPARRVTCFSNWAYAKAFIAAVCGVCCDSKSISIDRNLVKLDPIPARTQLDEVEVEVKTPHFSVADASVRIEGDTAFFSNGCKIVLDRTTGSVDGFAPGMENPYLSALKTPILKYSNRQAEIDPASNEYTGDRDFSEKAKINWTVAEFSAEKDEAVVTYRAADGELKWRFKAGTLDLDGRSFDGIQERVEVVRSPLLISCIEVEGNLTLPEPLFARRNSCYSPPRGYSDFDLTGKTKKVDTWTWKFFGSGQPFEMVVCENGVYLGNVTEPVSTYVRIKRADEKSPVFNMRNHNLGRVRAPVSTPYYCHWFSRGKERAHNDFLAMYQYVRQSLRRCAGLEEWTGYPAVWYNWQMTEEEKDATVEAAAEAGFRFVYPPLYESPIESLASPERLELFRKLSKRGVSVLAWSAGSYGQGMNHFVAQNHPEWMCRNEKGEIHTYPGNYTVIDVNNPEFFKWYKSILNQAIGTGVKWLYRDMDGAAAMQVNYGLPQSPDGLKSQIKFYRFLEDAGCRVSIEGMNPLVIDEYWVRAEKYTSFAGNEFSLVGQSFYGDIAGGVNLDAFRTGMYNSFPIIEYGSCAYGFDRVIGETQRGRRYARLVPLFNEALDHTGMPFVRETPFGTTWIGDRGGALFFWNPVKKAVVHLPENWKIRGVEGNILTDVKGDSIYFLDKD